MGNHIKIEVPAGPAGNLDWQYILKKYGCQTNLIKYRVPRFGELGRYIARLI